MSRVAPYLGLPLYDAERQFRAELLTETLRAHGWNRSHAARALGIERTYLIKIMRELKLSLPRPARWDHKRRTTPGERAEVLRRFRVGETYRAIEEATGLSRTTVETIIRRAGLRRLPEGVRGYWMS